ncbi:MAG: heat-shock protein Hsp20, partial [Rhodovarius sp.]|nr:heat-shock protein Hsp20 [Rhodovarius sp.]
IEVEGAWLDKGLLHIDLVRPMPEVRVKSIPITTRSQGTGRPMVDGRATREER